MKKTLSLIFLLTASAALTACSGIGGSSTELTKEGVSQYELSENEKKLLQAFGMADTSQILSFKAPKEAITLNANVYKLGDDGIWEMTGNGSIYIGDKRDTIEQLSGLFTMQLKDNYVVDFNINCGGRASFTSDEILPDKETMISSTTFMQEFQKIELNEEIPVAIMVYDSGSSIQGFSPIDYFEPSKFKDMDLVQAVTLEFSDKEL